MTQIDNEIDFRLAVSGLDDDAQRQLAAQFAAHVLALSNDKDIARGIAVADDATASASELDASFNIVKAATIESHTRCGAEGDWTAQAAYFVARACEAALMPEVFKKSGRALQAATAARMARTAHSIDSEEDNDAAERQAQYRILNKFLSKRGPA